MTLQECYMALGGNYEDVLQRMPGEDVVRILVEKFLEDDSFTALQKALQERDAQAAFRAAHTLKGVCQNLGFERLYASSRILTELLRGGSLDGTALPMRRVAQDYRRTLEAIQKFEASNRNSEG